MVSNSEEVWLRRLHNQSHSLIGTNSAGEGNGYHDRISFDVPHGYGRDSSKYNHWLHTVYFRDLINDLNPGLAYWRDKKRGEKLFTIDNCSDNFKNTFFKYVSNGKSWHRDEFLDEIGNWGRWLVHQGRLIFEMVNWYDNTTNEFYAFELKILDDEYCTIKKDKIIFKAPFPVNENQAQEKIIEIPKEKCIIMEWHNELGGYSFYKKNTEKVLSLGENHSSISTMSDWSWNPDKELNRMKRWDENFNMLTSVWGTNNPLNNTTDYYQYYTRLKFKGTSIYLMQCLSNGIEQILNRLNKTLNEKSILKVSDEDYNESKYLQTKSKWAEGKMTFKQLSQYLSHNY